MGEFNTGNPVPWAGLFCGRESELGELLAAYDRVAAGGGPEIAVLLGESGLGKTRLVQEFFARLSSGVDAAGESGYWPDRLVRDGNNLRINPDPRECNPGGAANMRFLWWGIRLLKGGRHNAGIGGVSATIPELRAHLEPFASAKLLSARIGAAARSAAIDVAIEIGNLFTFGLVGLGKLGLDHASEWKSIHEERRLLPTVSSAEEAERQQESLIDIVLADFATLFEAGEQKGERLPAVIVIDDAQWLDTDPATTMFVSKLLHRASEENWPLLILATHWEREWRETDRHTEHDTGAPNFAALVREVSGEEWQPLELRKEPDLSGMIDAGFAGLTRSQVELLLDKADGNPLLLDEILRHLVRRARLFEGRDRSGQLSPEGEEEISERVFGLHELIEERLAEAPEPVRWALGLASLQGDWFLDELVDLTANGLAEAKVADGLELARNPHSMIVRTIDSVTEFSQRVYREVAREQLEEFVDADSAFRHLKDAVHELAGDKIDFAALKPSCQGVAMVLSPQFLVQAADAADYELAFACWHKVMGLFEAQHLYEPAVACLAQAAEVAEAASAALPGGLLAELEYMMRFARRMSLPEIVAAFAPLVREQLEKTAETDENLRVRFATIASLGLLPAYEQEMTERLVALARTDFSEDESGPSFRLADALLNRTLVALKYDAAPVKVVRRWIEEGHALMRNDAWDDDIEWRMARATMDGEFSWGLFRLGDVAAARDMAGDSLRACQALAQECGDREDLGIRMIRGRGSAAGKLAIYAEAEGKRQLAMMFREEKVRDFETVAEAQPDYANRAALAQAIGVLAQTQRELGQIEPHALSRKRALQLWRELAHDAQTPEVQLNLFQTLVDLADFERARNPRAIDRPIELWDEALYYASELHRDEPSATTENGIIALLVRIGQGEMMRGRREEARSAFAHAIEMMEKWPLPLNPKKAATLAQVRKFHEDAQ